MSESFDRLPKGQKDLIVALPYRAGLWLSALEHSGGDEADEREATALLQALESVGNYHAKEFPAYICRLILARRQDWRDWSKDLSGVPSECALAVEYLFPVISPLDLEQYREAVFVVAASVASAYREEDNPEETLRDWADVSVRTQQLIVRLNAEAAKDQQNISSRERAALIVLAKSLGLGRVIAPLDEQS